jgi:PhnB protein
MAIKAAIPYLDLRGKAQEAVALYERALGAKVESLQRFGDVQQNCPDAMKNHVMHAVLRVGGATIYLSDGSPAGQVEAGGTLSIALDIDSASQGRESFAALAEGGTVLQPLIDAPWGAMFGALQDRYGINWMFNVAKG